MKVTALSILTVIFGSPLLIAFLGWLSLSVVEANKKNAEQDIFIQTNAKGVEASIKTNKLLCEMALDSDDKEKRKRFCVAE